MLKFIFFCLVLVNVVLFVLGNGYIDSPLYEVHQPERIAYQQNVAKLKQINAEVATAPIPDPTLATPQITPPTNPSNPLKPTVLACLSWGNFLQTDLIAVEAKLKLINLGNRQARQNVQDVTPNIVLIPPLGSKEAADKKALELTHLGVHDFFIISDQSNLRWGISLGVFKTEEAAKQYLATLQAKGVRSARLGIKTIPTNKFNYVFRNVTDDEKSELDKLKATYPNQTWTTCK